MTTLQTTLQTTIDSLDWQHDDETTDGQVARVASREQADAIRDYLRARGWEVSTSRDEDAAWFVWRVR